MHCFVLIISELIANEFFCLSAAFLLGLKFILKANIAQQQ